MADFLDPTTLILSHYSEDSISHYNNPNKPLELITDPYFMERGPRYNEYAQLRESKLQSKRQNLYEIDQISEIPKSQFSPLKKAVKFQDNFTQSKKQGNSILMQSVPNFSATIRKENRKPASENRIPKFEKSATPPPISMSKRERIYGSKSVNSGEKQSNGKLMMMGRKSYASIEELRGLSIATCNAINGESKGSKRNGGNVLRKSTVFSTSKYY